MRIGILSISGLLLFALFVATLKLPFGYISNSAHRVITISQFILLFFIGVQLIKLNSSDFRKFSVGLVFVMGFYHLLRFGVQGIIEPTASVLLGGLFGMVKVLHLIILHAVWSARHKIFRSKRSIIRLVSYLLGVTLVYSILQSPVNPYSSYFIGIGGNVTSGNHLGFFRATGGLGGTVIEYATFLSCVVLIYFFSVEWKYKKVFLIVLIVSLVLCFSRSSWIVFFLAYLFSFYEKYVEPNSISKLLLFISCIILISVSTYLAGGLYKTVIELNQVVSGTSDDSRIIGWENLFSNLDWYHLILGFAPGGNFGFGGLGITKISGDGFVFGWIYEYGLMGIVLYLAVILYPIFSLRNSLLRKAFLCLIIVFIHLVNSGMWMLTNTILLYLFYITMSGPMPVHRLKSSA